MRELLYDIDNKRWLHLELSPVGLQLRAWQHGDANDSEKEWYPIDFPETLTVWNQNRSYHYFLQGETLYRYYQSPITIPPMLLKPENKKGLDKRLEACSGFIDTEGNAYAQKIELLREGSWQPASLSVIDSIRFDPYQLLLQDIEPVEPAPPLTANVDQNTWEIQRQELPQFYDSIETDVPSVVHWQLDELAKQCLSFKEQTENKEEYLQSLEVMLGNIQLADTLKENPNVPFVLQQQRLIRNIRRYLRDADSMDKDALSLYMLRRLEQEYVRVSGKALPFSVDLNAISSVDDEPSPENTGLNSALEIYEEVLNDQAYPGDYITIYQCLKPSDAPQNAHNLVSHWLVASEESVEAVARLCLRRIARTLRLNFSDDELNSFYAADLNTDEGLACAHRNPALFALIDKDFAISLLEKLDTLKSLPIFMIVEQNEEFALALLTKPTLLESLSLDTLCWILKIYSSFRERLFGSTDLLKSIGGNVFFDLAKKDEEIALLLLEKPDVMELFTSKQLYNIAEIHQTFALALLNNLMLLKTMDPNDLVLLMLKNNDFAKALFPILLDNLDLLNKFPGHLLVLIISTYREFLSALTERSDVLEMIDGSQLGEIARNNKDFALWLVNQPTILVKIESWTLGRIAEGYKEFVPTLLEKPDTIKVLSESQIRQLACVKKTFAPALLEKPNILELLDGVKLAAIAYRRKSFALALIERPELLLKFDRDSLCKIAESHSEFRKALLEKISSPENVASETFESVQQKLFAAVVLFNVSEIVQSNRQKESLLLSNACIETIKGSQSSSELSSILKEERMRLEGLQPAAASLPSLFAQPRALQHLDQCVQVVEQFNLHDSAAPNALI